MIYYETMSNVERPFRRAQTKFPREQDKHLDVLLQDLRINDPERHKGLFGSVRILLARFFPIHPYKDIEEVRTGTTPEFLNRVLDAFSSHVKAIEAQKQGDIEAIEDLTHLVLKGVQLASRLLSTKSINLKEELESVVFPTTIPLGRRLNDIEKHAIHDLSIGIGVGSIERSVAAAERMAQDALEYFPENRHPKANNDVGDDFIHFLLISDLEQLPKPEKS